MVIIVAIDCLIGATLCFASFPKPAPRPQARFQSQRGASEGGSARRDGRKTAPYHDLTADLAFWKGSLELGYTRLGDVCQLKVQLLQMLECCQFLYPCIRHVHVPKTQ